MTPIRSRFVFPLAILVAILGSSLAVVAQVPTRQARFFLDSVSQTNACNANQETWLIMSGTCSAPGTTPWVQTVRMRIGSTTVDVPRANVTRLTAATECAPNAAPCLRSAPVTIPAGNVTFAFVTGAGDESEPSAAIPFSPAAAQPSVPGAPRLVVTP